MSGEPNTISRPLRIYISGPITGMPGLNRPAFDAAAEHILAAGFVPVNPFDLIDHERAQRDGWQWSDYMRVDIAALCECDAILMLDGWMSSDGATLESRIASSLGIPMLWCQISLRIASHAATCQFLTDARMTSVRKAIDRASDVMMVADAEHLSDRLEGAA